MWFFLYFFIGLLHSVLIVLLNYYSVNHRVKAVGVVDFILTWVSLYFAVKYLVLSPEAELNVLVYSVGGAIGASAITYYNKRKHEQASSSSSNR